MGVAGLVAHGANSIPAFVVFVMLLAAWGVVSGIAMPVRQAFINEYIPSAQRATVLSFDSFFSDIGAVGGQLGFGAIAQGASKALAYTIAGLVYLIGVPLYRKAGRGAHPQTVEPTAMSSAGGTAIQAGEATPT
jgi:MFS family permease